MPDKRHLDFDLGFLDKESPKPKIVNTFNHNYPFKNTWNWKFMLGLIVVISIIGMIYYFLEEAEPDKTTKLPNSATSLHTLPDQNNINIVTGEYRCSEYHDRKAQELLPAESERVNLANEERKLLAHRKELERLSSKISATLVDQYSQESIDNYNALVDDYNSKKQMFNEGLDDFKRRADHYDAQISEYNDYLKKYCTPVTR